MSITSKFLTLSIREQLFITILILTLFSVIVILCLPISFSYEILMEDYKKKKKFFYNEYKEYIEACFYFQSFTLLKYEEIIKRFAKQMDKYTKKEDIFDTSSTFKDTYNDTYPVQDLFENDENDVNILYKYCYNIPQICQLNEEQILDKFQDKYESLDGLIFSHDLDTRFKIPGYQTPIISSIGAVSINNGLMFGFGKEGLYNLIVNTSDYSKINRTNLLLYYKNIITEQITHANYNIRNYLDSNLFLFKDLFYKVVDEMNGLEEREIFNIPNINKTWAFIYYIKAVTGYYSTIDLANDKCYFLTCINTDGEGINYKYYYSEFNLIKNYLEIISDTLSNMLNIDFIPLYSYNHTIISPAICSKFLLKQSNKMFDEKILNETFNKMHKGESGIDECFYDKKILDSKIKEIFKTNITHFLTIPNKIHQGLINLNKPYYFMKYSFPNLNPLKEFLSDYLIIDQIDFYLFAPFKEPIEYSNYIKDQYYNLFYLMIILIIYIWIICLIINMIIYCKVAKQITEPIYKLQEAIENNNIKDESVFVYEYDDIINELFITCKELLTGNIDTSNNMKYSGQFNILNNQKDKDKIIDKNKYEKNLIINNDIVNQLINEQQNMMNFGDEIDINDDDYINNEKDERDTHRRKTSNSRMTNNKDIENKDNLKQSKIEEDKEKGKSSYKSLFKLAQYLYYYRCKVEGSVINININNTNTDDKNSNVSKLNNNPKSKNERRIKKSPSRSKPSEKNDEKNISINVLPDKDLTYLWYMEMKKKNNRSFNYELSDDYEELFMDNLTNKNV